MDKYQIEALGEAGDASVWVLKSFYKHVKTLKKSLQEEGEKTGEWSEKLPQIQKFERSLWIQLVTLEKEWIDAYNDVVE